MKKTHRLIVLFLASVIACLIIGGVWLRSSLPQTSGEITLPGLTGKVTVSRNDLGIPAIAAGSERDAYFALGFVHAQDRLFQMDMMRRNGQGRLAEVIGEPGLVHDRKSRGLGLYGNAKKSLATLPPPVLEALTAYSEGVNAYLAHHRGALPLEFTVLGYEPEQWAPVDSLLWGRLMAVWLSGNHFDELRRSILSKTLTKSQIDDLWPPYPEDAISGVTGGKHLKTRGLPDRSHMAPSVSAVVAALGKRILNALPAPKGPVSASNAWAVAGELTSTGKPILANDPHLWLATPGVWYLARIDAPGLHLAGATSPGVPFLILGHNDRIAWGMTTTHSDTQDLFIERIDPDDPNAYLTPEGSRPFEIRKETITVRGGEPVEMVQRLTRHGPVLSDYLDLPEETDDLSILAGENDEGTGHGDDGAYVLALADPALSGVDISFTSIYGINHAANWDEFTTALSHGTAPQQNLHYADIDGNIGFYAPALVPIRKKGDGMDPVPGWTGEYDWAGFIPFESLPHAYNPAAGRLVSANHNIVEADYPHHLTRSWPSSYRVGRIHSLLSEHPRQSMETMAAIQNDIISPMARDLLPRLLEIVNVAGVNDQAAKALTLLGGWDGTMDRQRPEPLIFSSWINEIQRLIAEDELGANHKDMSGTRPRFIKNVLSANSIWCDDVTSEETETCEERLKDALNAAIANLVRLHGQDMTTWQWGDSHTTGFTPRIFNRLPLIGGWLGRTIATDGGNHTINRGTYILNITGLYPGASDFPHVHGPTMRAIYDLASLDNSLFMITPGQSGNIFSSHHNDLVPAWRDGLYVTLPKQSPREDGEVKNVSDNEVERPQNSPLILHLLPKKKFNKMPSIY